MGADDSTARAALRCLPLPAGGWVELWSRAGRGRVEGEGEGEMASRATVESWGRHLRGRARRQDAGGFAGSGQALLARGSSCLFFSCLVLS